MTIHYQASERDTLKCEGGSNHINSKNTTQKERFRQKTKITVSVERVAGFNVKQTRAAVLKYSKVAVWFRQRDIISLIALFGGV